MAKEGAGKDKGEEQPKVFQFSEEEMEKLLQDKDQIAAGVEAKPKQKKKPPGPAEAAGPEIEALKKRAEERDKFLDRLQRLQAEYINYQKRVKRERVELGDQAVKGFLEDLLPLLDDFDGARRTVGGGDPESVVKGIRMLRDRLWKVLSDYGVSEIPTEGEDFDPKVHEAFAQEFSPDAEDGAILQVIQQGYMFKEWVLRASRVKIARTGEPETPSEPAPAAPPKADAAPAAPAAPDTAPPSVSGNPLLDEPEEQPHA